MELREHIGKPVKNHRVIEGGCYDRGVYYLMFGNMKKKTTVIVKLKAGSEKEVLGASEPLKVGHANDCCVKGGIVYITHSGGRGVIHRVSAHTLEKLPDIKIKGCEGGFNGISCMGNGFILKKIGSRKCYIFDGGWNIKKHKEGKHKGKPKTITLSSTMKVGQGMTWHKGKLYRGSSVGQSKRNWVCVYNSKGKLVKKYHYKHKCELEDVFVVDGKIKISIYKKPKKKGKRRFQAFIRTLKK